MANYKKIVLKKMSAKDLTALLKKSGACSAARKWAKGKTLQKAWATCQQGQWMSWLLWKMADCKNWPSEVVSRRVNSAAYDVYYRTQHPNDISMMAEFLRKQVVFK